MACRSVSSRFFKLRTLAVAAVTVASPSRKSLYNHYRLMKSLKAAVVQQKRNQKIETPSRLKYEKVSPLVCRWVSIYLFYDFAVSFFINHSN